MRNHMMLLVVLAAGCRTQGANVHSNDAGLGGASSTVVTGGASATGGIGLGGANGTVVTGGATATGGVGPGTGGEPAGGGGAAGASATGGAGAAFTGGAASAGTAGPGGASATGGAAGEPATSNSGGAAVGTGGTGTGGAGTGGIGAGGAGGTVVTRDASATGGAGGALTGGSASAGTAGTRGDAGSGTCAFVGPCTSTVVYDYGGYVSVTKTSFFYDANNRLIREEGDYNGDGAADNVTRYSYDEHGWLLELKSDGCGSDGSVTSCRWLSYTYDAQGNVLTLNDRSFYSGRVAGCTAFTYDASGHLLKTEFSGRCSGTVQEVVVYSYDSAWRLISKTWENNGTPGETITYQYDAAGFVASEIRGTSEVVTYTRNAAGLPLVEEHRMAAASLADDYRIIRTYDSTGNQLTERTKYLTGVSVGTDEFCSTNTYDQCGNVLTYDSQNYCGQPGGSKTTYSYECFSR